MKLPSQTISSSQPGFQQALAFCEAILPRVSRTFAINIRCLSGELYQAVLCGYLFCRIIDTVEDSSRLTCETKIAALEFWADHFPFNRDPSEKEKWLHLIFNAPEIKDTNLPLTDNQHETELMQHTDNVFHLFFHLLPSSQQYLNKTVTTMARGMAKFQKQGVSAAKPQSIRTVQELEEYCYYVAGTVGEMLTGLFIEQLPDLSPENKRKLNDSAIEFGLGLQLTNILKDIRDDRARNWCYIPKDLLDQAGLSSETLFQKGKEGATHHVLAPVLDLAKKSLDKALIYSLTLPRHNRELRLFCLLPLHFAIQTLAKYQSSAFDSTHQVKISRMAVRFTLLITRLSFSSNLAQKLLYSFYRRQIR